MRRLLQIALALLVCGVVAAAQENKEQKRPTLGPSPAPSLHGAHNAITTDRARLLLIRKIYVERMDNHLSDDLLDALSKSGRFRIVVDRDQADGVLRGTCLDSRRLKTVHSEVFLSDRVTGSSVWQDNVHQPYNPPPLKKAVADTAVQILNHLAASVLEAQHH
jgi:hypothetical protein